MDAAAHPFGPVVRELDRWSAAGMTASIWLRDDDATEHSPALDRLLALTEQFGCPAAIAAIPARATERLAQRLAKAPLATVCVHGFRHVNHAPAHMKKTELTENGPGRTPDHVIQELCEGLAILRRVCGGETLPILVPPWNRMSAAVAHRAHEAGFAAVSGFGWIEFPCSMPQLNTHVDLIDWRGGRSGHAPAPLAELSAQSLRIARQSGAAAVGILTHHLAHDDTAWRTLELLLATLHGHEACRFADLRELLSGA